MKIFAENITIKGAIWGEITINEKYFTFNSLATKRPEDVKDFMFGALKNTFIEKVKKKLFFLKKIKMILPRSYNL